MIFADFSRQIFYFKIDNYFLLFNVSDNQLFFMEQMGLIFPILCLNSDKEILIFILLLFNDEFLLFFVNKFSFDIFE